MLILPSPRPYDPRILVTQTLQAPGLIQHRQQDARARRAHWKRQCAQSRAWATLMATRAPLEVICCNQWQAITTLPFHCATCGHRYFQQKA